MQDAEDFQNEDCILFIHSYLFKFFRNKQSKEMSNKIWKTLNHQFKKTHLHHHRNFKAIYKIQIILNRFTH